MTTQPLLTHRLHRQDGGDSRLALVRQWRLLEKLSLATKGLTVKELVAESGMSDRTVRRDVAFLKQIGFDVAETVEDYGVKRYRIRHPSEATEEIDARQGKYGLIFDALQQLHDTAQGLGDLLLAADLEGVQLRVERQFRKSKPR